MLRGRAAAQLPRSPVPEPAPARDVAPEPSASPAASPPPPPGPVPTLAARSLPPPKRRLLGRHRPTHPGAPLRRQLPLPRRHAPNVPTAPRIAPGLDPTPALAPSASVAPPPTAPHCAGFRPCAAACAGGASACRRFETTAANIAGCVAKKFGATRLATAHGAYSQPEFAPTSAAIDYAYLGPITVSARAIEPSCRGHRPRPGQNQRWPVRDHPSSHSGCVTTPIRASHSHCRVRAYAPGPVRGSAGGLSGEDATATDGASLFSRHAREQPLAGALPALNQSAPRRYLLRLLQARP